MRRALFSGVQRRLAHCKAGSAVTKTAAKQGAAYYDKLFAPTKLGKLELKNHFAMAPMGPLGFCDAGAGWNQRGIEYYTARARGGVGLLITGVTFVENPAELMADPPIVPSSVKNPGHFVRTSRELVERVHAHDSKILLQISPGFGRVLLPGLLPEGQLASAPSVIPNRWKNEMCREMTVQEIKKTIANTIAGAKAAQKAGFDGVQIHAVHEGYLLDQFAIAMFNNRTDEYGGSLENRLRFAREIVEGIKKVCGKDFPVTLRFSPKSMIKDWKVGGLPGEEFVEQGRDLPEGIEAAKLLVQYGYDALDVDVGSYDSWFWSHPPMYQDKGLYMPYSKPIKEAIGNVPVILAGRMDNPELATRALNEGYADIISLGRPLLADPDFVNKLAAGKQELIRPCLSCQEGCMGRIQAFRSLNCAVNPESGREADHLLTPALVPKKVLIVGGGVGGMEAARVLALRGHHPILHEAGNCLGGVVVAGGQPSFKEDDLALVSYYEATLRDLGVEVHLNSPVSAKMIEEADVDHVIVATGAKARQLALGEELSVIEAVDALLEPKPLVGKRIAIVGGGLTGCELGLYLKELDKNTEVTIIEQGADVLAMSGPLCTANLDMLHDLVRFRNIKVVSNARALRTAKEGLWINEPKGERLVECDVVVPAVGYKSDSTLFNEVRHLPVNKNLLGDARSVSNIMYAIWDAYEVAAAV